MPGQSVLKCGTHEKGTAFEEVLRAHFGNGSACFSCDLADTNNVCHPVSCSLKKSESSDCLENLKRILVDFHLVENITVLLDF